MHSCIHTLSHTDRHKLFIIILDKPLLLWVLQKATANWIFWNSIRDQKGCHFSTAFPKTSSSESFLQWSEHMVGCIEAAAMSERRRTSVEERQTVASFFYEFQEVSRPLTTKLRRLLAVCHLSDNVNPFSKNSSSLSGSIKCRGGSFLEMLPICYLVLEAPSYHCPLHTRGLKAICLPYMANRGRFFIQISITMAIY